MSQLQTNQGSFTAGRYSKRRRTQVNYYEGVSDAEDVDSEKESQNVVEYSQSKKRKSLRPSKPLAKRKVFPFLELPAEIRNMIYGYCLIDTRGVYLLSTTQNYRRTVERAPSSYMERVCNQRQYSDGGIDDEEKKFLLKPQLLVPSLLAVNNQIYKEGRDVLYGNEFKLGDPLAMHSFVANLGPRAASYLKYVTLLSWGGWRGMHKAYNHASFAVLATATNIKKFKIDGYLCCRSLPVWVARQIYRDGFPWLEAVGAAKGRVDAAVELIEVSNVNFEGRGWRRRDQADPEKDMEEFRAELSRLLGAYMKKIRSKPAQKANKKVSEEL